MAKTTSGLLPAYLHDCSKCKYLGSIKLNQVYDLYIHCSEIENSLIARFSDEPSYYSSILVSMITSPYLMSSSYDEFIPTIQALAIAYKIAKLEGLTGVDDNE